MRKLLSPLAAVAALALSLSPAAHAESGWGQLNMTPGVTAMSRQIYGLHMLKNRSGNRYLMFQPKGRTFRPKQIKKLD